MDHLRKATDWTMGKADPTPASFPLNAPATPTVAGSREVHGLPLSAGDAVIATATDCQVPIAAKVESEPDLETNPDETTAAELAPDELTLDEQTPLTEHTLDPATLTEWVTLHHAVLYRYAYRLAGNPTDAEDLTQQTYLVASQQGMKVREAEKVLGWLLTVLRNCYLKSRRRPPLSTGHLLEKELEAIPETTQWPAWDREELQQALQSLPEEFRLVVMLFYFEDISYKEIAERLQTPLGTVMSRLSRGKKLLRGRLLGPETS